MLIHKLITAIALWPATAALALPHCEGLTPQRVEDVEACHVLGFIDKPCKVGEIVVDGAMRAALLGLSTFNLTPVTSEVRMSWTQGSTRPEYAMLPPASDAVFQHAIRLDMVRRSAYVTRDGASVYIVDTSGPLQETRWFGPMSWSEVAQLCQDAVAA